MVLYLFKNGSHSPAWRNTAITQHLAAGLVLFSASDRDHVAGVCRAVAGREPEWVVAVADDLPGGKDR